MMEWGWGMPEPCQNLRLVANITIHIILAESILFLIPWENNKGVLCSVCLRLQFQRPRGANTDQRLPPFDLFLYLHYQYCQSPLGDKHSISFLCTICPGQLHPEARLWVPRKNFVRRLQWNLVLTANAHIYYFWRQLVFNFRTHNFAIWYGGQG